MILLIVLDRFRAVVDQSRTNSLDSPVMEFE